MCYLFGWDCGGDRDTLRNIRVDFIFGVLQGEAKSAQLIGQAIANNPAFITLRKIEAAREIAQTISHSANKVYLSADDLLLNLQDFNLGTARK